MQLIKILKHISSNLRIDADYFQINYDNFLGEELTPDTLKQIQKLSPEFQYQYLSSQLLDLLFSIYYTGSRKKQGKKELDTNEVILERIASQGVDWEFYEKLEKSNTGTGWLHPDYEVIRAETDGSLAIYYDGVTIHVDPNKHIDSVKESPKVGDFVCMWTPPSFINNGFYSAVGNTSRDFQQNTHNTFKQVVFVYLNFSSQAAIKSMESITRTLNDMSVPFKFEVLCNPLNYKRYDSGVLVVFNNDKYELIREVLANIYTDNQSEFDCNTPLFTKRLAPGIGLAEHPNLQFTYQETFGVNRFRIVANALLEAHKNGDESPESRMKYILQNFEKLGIDIERPYLNPNSEDIYTPIC